MHLFTVNPTTMYPVSKNEYDRLRIQLTADLSPGEVLTRFLSLFPGRVTFSSSFSYEDQVITHMLRKFAVRIFTLDTGRLFQQTYNTWQETQHSFGVDITAFYPDNALLEPFVAGSGPNAFYQSVAQRKQCCHIRKVEPLKRALKGQAVWITGLRAAHSPDRSDLELLEWDESNQVIKYHPLLHWTTEEVKRYISQYKIPFNVLQEKGYVSIGCEPCTRAIRPGEDFRAGRWWWEDSSKKECGLHEHGATR